MESGTIDFEETNSRFAPPPSATEIESVAPSEVLAAIRKFPTGSAGGGSGLTPEHFKELVGCPDAQPENGLVEGLATLTCTSLKGHGTQTLANWFVGSPITSPSKSEGGLRPIAVGETMRRLTSSIALKRFQGKAAQLLYLHQFGVATRNEGETIIYAVRKWAHDKEGNSSYGLLQIDLEKALNKVRRRVMIREVERHLPKISLWVRYCYGEEREPILWTNNIHTRSHAGVQQGDPLGPLLFCLALRPILK